MSAIFISHSSIDSELAQDLQRRLAERNHHSVFLDLDPEKGIVGGQSWERTLYRKLRACRVVIALCTDHYLGSNWCFAEIALARMEGKQVIALQADPLGAHTRMPAILTQEQFIDLRAKGDEGFARLWRALRELDFVGVAGEWDPKQPPYLGLSAYQEKHAPVFFGREVESLAGIELLERGAPNLVMVLGASGSGKSSLILAGMLPRLRSREQHWLIVDPFRPGRDPLAELTESLAQGYFRYAREHVDGSGGLDRMREKLRAAWDVDAPESASAGDDRKPSPVARTDERLHRLIELLERLRENPPPLFTDRLRDHLEWSLEDLRRICGVGPIAESASPAPERAATPLVEIARDLRRVANRREARVLIVIDQFEEVLGRERPGEKPLRFLDLLRAAIESEHSPVMVLATMRSDFLGLFQRHAALQGIDFASLSLGPMGIEGMRRVIQMPAKLAAIEFEEGFVERLLEDTETPDALPLLSFTLSVLCRDRRDNGKLELSEYERLGGLQGTISREADAVLASASREHKEDELRIALLQMARLSEDGSYARVAVDWDKPEIARAKPILDKLVERRVLVSRVQGDAPVVEVAHEALFRTWKPLEAWLDNSRSELLLKQQLDRDAVTWQESNHAADNLWRGGRLLQAGELVGKRSAGRAGAKAELTTEFVRAGLRRRRQLRIALAAVIAVVIAVLAGFLAYSLEQADQARQEKNRALDLARVAVAAEWLDKDPTKAALLLLEVEEPENTRFAPRRLSEALSRALVSAEYHHAEPVHSAAISPDGSRVLTTSDKQAIVWDARTSRKLRTMQLDETVIGGSFGPTGRFVVVRPGVVDKMDYLGRGGNKAWVYEAETGKLRLVASHDDRIEFAAFSPDGRFMATASKDHTAKLWDVESGQLKVPPLQHADAVSSASFSPDGQLLATISGDITQLWTVQTGEPSGSALTQENGAHSATFSPDGSLVATAGYHAVKVWEVKSGELKYPPLPLDLARIASFSADGRYLLTASDSQARLWFADTGSPSNQFAAPMVHANMGIATLSTDGTLAITGPGYRQGTAEPITGNALLFWDAEKGESRFVKDLKHRHSITTLAFGPGNKSVVSTSGDRALSGRSETLRRDTTARLWNVETRDKRLVLALEHESDVSRSSSSPDGRLLLTVSDTSIRLWDWRTLKPLGVDLEHAKAVTSASFASDGKLVISSSRDGTARVWDLESRRERFVAKHAGEVSYALLVAGGKRLATLSAGKLRLWNVSSGTAEVGAELFEVADYSANLDDSIPGDTISPDGNFVAARSGNNVQVWDVREESRPRFTLKHDEYVRTAAFIGDGKFLVTGADETVARIWDMGSGDPKFRLEHAAKLERVSVSPDGRTVLTVPQDGIARLWSSKSGKELFKLQQGQQGCDEHDGWFIAGGRIAVTRSDGNKFTSDCESKIMLWNVATGQLHSTIAVGEATGSTQFSTDGKLMLSMHGRTGFGDPDLLEDVESMIGVWDANSGEERFTEPFTSAERMTAAAFSPDGEHLMAASGNNVWVWAVSGELLQSALAATTTVCLKPEFRRQNLGETDAEARKKYEACERGHGRESKEAVPLSVPDVLPRARVGTAETSRIPSSRPPVRAIAPSVEHANAEARQKQHRDLWAPDVRNHGLLGDGRESPRDHLLRV